MRMGLKRKGDGGEADRWGPRDRMGRSGEEWGGVGVGVRVTQGDGG